MSDEFRELTQVGLEAINETYRTGDTSFWARHVERTFDPDVVLQTEARAFTEGKWRGRDGAVEFVANQMEVLEGMWMVADEIIEIGEARVVALITFGGRARHTGIEVELSPGHIFDLRDGKVVHWRVFPSHRLAREAAGLTD